MSAFGAGLAIGEFALGVYVPLSLYRGVISYVRGGSANPWLRNRWNDVRAFRNSLRPTVRPVPVTNGRRLTPEGGDRGLYIVTIKYYSGQIDQRTAYAENEEQAKYLVGQALGDLYYTVIDVQAGGI